MSYYSPTVEQVADRNTVLNQLRFSLPLTVGPKYEVLEEREDFSIRLRMDVEPSKSPPPLCGIRIDRQVSGYFASGPFRVVVTTYGWPQNSGIPEPKAVRYKVSTSGVVSKVLDRLRFLISQWERAVKQAHEDGTRSERIRRLISDAAGVEFVPSSQKGYQFGGGRWGTDGSWIRVIPAYGSDLGTPSAYGVTVHFAIDDLSVLRRVIDAVGGVSVFTPKEGG